MIIQPDLPYPHENTPMRVTLTQDELFEAISSHLTDKLNLDNTASIEISFTAGRGPKGYTADVDITYPKSEQASKFVAKDHEDDAANAIPEAITHGAMQAGNLFTN